MSNIVIEHVTCITAKRNVQNLTIWIVDPTQILEKDNFCILLLQLPQGENEKQNDLKALKFISTIIVMWQMFNKCRRAIAHGAINHKS